MNEAHEHDPAYIHLFVCVFPQKVSHDCHMPGMFCIVFISSVTGQVSLAENIFFLVYFQGKSQLAAKPFIIGHLYFLLLVHMFAIE